jgi:hypothetical protein
MTKRAYLAPGYYGELLEVSIVANDSKAGGKERSKTGLVWSVDNFLEYHHGWLFYRYVYGGFLFMTSTKSSRSESPQKASVAKQEDPRKTGHTQFNVCKLEHLREGTGKISCPTWIFGKETVIVDVRKVLKVSEELHQSFENEKITELGPGIYRVPGRK